MDDERYKATRRRVVGLLVIRLVFFGYLIFFLFVMALLWFSDNMTSDRALGAAFGSFMLALPVFVLGLLAFNPLKGLIDRQTRRELERAEVYEKPKRKRLELTEDGELVELADEIPDEERYANR